MSKRWMVVLLMLAMVFASTVGIADECPEGGEHDWSFHVEGFEDNPYNQRCTKCKQECPGHVWKGSERCSICTSLCRHESFTQYVCNTCGTPCKHDQGATDFCYHCGIDLESYRVVLSYGDYETEGITYKVYAGFPKEGTAKFTLPDLINDFGYKMPEGKGFYKWSCFSNGSITNCDAGDAITVNGNLSISADIRKDPVTITFKDGRTSYHKQTYVMNVPLGSMYTMPTAEEIGFTFTTGYRLKAWEHGSITNYDEYLPGAEVEAVEDRTYYASTEEYEVEKEYVTITYNPNGGSGTMEPQVVEKEKYTNLSPMTFTPPEGYEFYAWYDDAQGKDGNGKRYWENIRHKFSEDITLYAHWNPIKCEFKYDPNNGTGIVYKYTSDKYYGDVVALKTPEGLGASIPENCEFVGWNDGKEIYPAGYKYTILGDVRMTAVWKENAPTQVKYGLIVDPSNGEAAKNIGDILSVGEPFVFPNSVTNFGFTAKEDSIFVGWKVGNTTYKPGDTYTVSGALTITAVWQDLYTLTIDPANGIESAKTSTAKFAPGEPIILPKTMSFAGLSFSDKEGCTLLGWMIDGTKYDLGAEYIINKNVTLTAVWSEPAPVIYAVSFDANGGSGTMASAEVQNGTNYTLPACTFTAADDKHVFDCWLVNGKEMNPGDKITVTGNVTVKAQWAKSELTFTYKVNGGNGEDKTETVKYGTTYTLPTAEKLNMTALLGMDFDGWSADGVNKLDSNSIAKVRTDMTFYALWKDASFTAAKDIKDVTITEEMKEIGLDTHEKVVTKMEENTTQKGYAESQVEHVDVVLMLWDDEKGEYIEATAENFPAEGITAAIDVPDAVPGDANDYDFILYHMTTTGSKAGEIEEIVPTLQGNMLYGTFKTLSPVTIAWKEKTPEKVAEDLPKTGDPSSLMSWMLLLGASGTGFVALRRKKR